MIIELSIIEIYFLSRFSTVGSHNAYMWILHWLQ